MAFQNDHNYAVEFALRTQLNYLMMQEKECLDNPSDDSDRKIQEISEIRHCIYEKMNELELRQIPYCVGTQLMNSFLGLIVIPEQQEYNFLDKRTSWTGLEVLRQYVFNEKGIYENTYRDKCGQPERKTPANVIRHMRNAISHKRLNVIPLASANQEMVTHIKFCDNDKDHRSYRFVLQIDIEDVETIIFEISNLIIDHELNKRFR